MRNAESTICGSALEGVREERYRSAWRTVSAPRDDPICSTGSREEGNQSAFSVW